MVPGKLIAIIVDTRIYNLLYSYFLAIARNEFEISCLWLQNLLSSVCPYKRWISASKNDF